MKLFLVISAFAAAVLSLPGVSSALDYTADLSASLSEKYDDNIFLSHTDRVSDFITVVSPSVALSTRTERVSLLLNYSPSLNFFTSHEDKNSITHQALLRGQYLISERLNIGVTDSFIQTRESQVIRDVEGSGPIIAGLEKITTNTLSSNLSYRLSEELTLQPSAIYTHTANSQPDIGDVTTYIGSLNANYRLTERITLHTNAAYTLYKYTLSSDAKGQDYNIGASYVFDQTLKTDAYGGINITRVNDADSAIIGFTGGFSATKTFETGSANISYKQNVSAGAESASPVRSQVLSLRLSRPVTDHLDASINASYSLFKALNNGFFFSTLTNRRDVTGSADLSYKLMPWVSLRASYTYVNSHDKVSSSGSYYSHTAMLGFRVAQQAKF
jgi:hypothetical protein